MKLKIRKEKVTTTLRQLDQKYKVEITQTPLIESGITDEEINKYIKNGGREKYNEK